MQVIRELPGKEKKCVLALGNFDGVHLGHRRLLECGLTEAKRRGVPFAVLLFCPHPLQVLFPEQGIKLLTTEAERLKVLEEIGVDIIYLLPFTKSTAAMSPESFVTDILLNLGAVHVVVGFNYSFGAKAKGTPEDLQAFGEKMGFTVSVLQAQVLKGRVISSSAIRKAIIQGDISSARDMLGRYPCLCGEVVSGEQRGRLLGYPTANLLPPGELLMPKRGVYAVQAELFGKKVYGMMNIGMKPTFHEEYRITAEVHFLNFNQDLYGRNLHLEIVQRIRDEKKFSGTEELIQQLTRDTQQVQHVLELDINCNNFTN